MINNLIDFLNSFMTYGLLVLIIAALSGVAFALGRILKKRKNASEVQQAVEVNKE